MIARSFGKRESLRNGFSCWLAVAIAGLAGLLAGCGDIPYEDAFAPPVELQVGGSESPALRFIALGDWGRRGEPLQREVAASMGLVAESLAVDFVLALGDNFYPSGVSGVDDPQWRESFEEVYTAPSLQLPWYAILGNHDYAGDVSAQIAYTEQSARWRLTARSRTLRLHGPQGLEVDLLLLDSHPLQADVGLDPQSLLNWSAEQLQQSRQRGVRWQLVATHYPLYSGGSHSGSTVLRADLEGLFEHYGVALVLGGHDHDLQLLRPARFDQLVSGSAARVRAVRWTDATLFAAARAGFAVVEVTSDSLVVGFYGTGARQLARHSRPHPSQGGQP